MLQAGDQGRRGDKEAEKSRSICLVWGSRCLRGRPRGLENGSIYPVLLRRLLNTCGRPSTGREGRPRPMGPPLHARTRVSWVEGSFLGVVPSIKRSRQWHIACYKAWLPAKL